MSEIASPTTPDVPTTIIKPRTGWQLIDWAEMRDYRDLFRFLVWREIKVRYAQSMLGIGWAIIQPLFSMIVFAIIFGRLAQVESDGVPYPIFSFVGLVPWTYFANALSDSTASMVANANIISKVYFPRIFLPLAAVVSKLLDFCIAMVPVAALLVWYGFVPNWGVLAFPLLIALMMLTAGGLGSIEEGANERLETPQNSGRLLLIRSASTKKPMSALRQPPTWF